MPLTLQNFINILVSRRLGGLRTEEIQRRSDEVRKNYSDKIWALLNDLTKRSIAHEMRLKDKDKK